MLELPLVSFVNVGDGVTEEKPENRWAKAENLQYILQASGSQLYGSDIVVFEPLHAHLRELAANVNYRDAPTDAPVVRPPTLDELRESLKALGFFHGGRNTAGLVGDGELYEIWCNSEVHAPLE